MLGLTAALLMIGAPGGDRCGRPKNQSSDRHNGRPRNTARGAAAGAANGAAVPDGALCRW